VAPAATGSQQDSSGQCQGVASGGLLQGFPMLAKELAEAVLEAFLRHKHQLLDYLAG
jgi:hypothetical protein